MGTLETIVLILSYIKHNPGARPRDIFHAFEPDVAEDYGPEIYRQELEHYQNLIFGLEEDKLLFRKEPHSHCFYLGSAISDFSWGFQRSIDSQKTVTTTVVQTYCHLGSETEPSLQTLMQFSRKQAIKQLMQLIGSLL